MPRPLVVSLSRTHGDAAVVARAVHAAAVSRVASLAAVAVLPAVLFVASTMGCGGGGANPRVRETVARGPDEAHATIEAHREDGGPPAAGEAHGAAFLFHATSGAGDAPAPYVRDERSSRLDVTLPRGHLREQWRAPLGPPRGEPCRGTCPPMQASFVLAAGDHVAASGADAWTLYDTTGRRLDAGTITSGSVRLDRASGLIVRDDTRASDLPADAKLAAHAGLVVMVRDGAVHIGERAIEGRFEAIDVAIDDAAVACVLLRQADELLLWTVPLASGVGIGRQRIAGASRAVPRALGPPILGKSFRVVRVDTGLLAIGLDGKRIWEHRGVSTGGASITADDHVLVADNGKILAIDPRGHVTELYALSGVVFVTPPILNAKGTLFVASGESLHALTFDGRD